MDDLIRSYLNDLKKELEQADSALVQDALYDAEEYLRTSLERLRAENPDSGDHELLATIIEKYGAPEETARFYLDMERRVIPVYRKTRHQNKRSLLGRFLGVLIDPQAYAAFLFLIFSLVTGIIYFTWAVTGLSLSAGFIILIFGIPFFGLFLLSIQGLALVEGRMVEAMTGVRMPRRPIFYRRDLSAWEKFKHLASSGSTWKSILYMILKLPLGIISFTVAVTMLALSLAIIVSPALQVWLDIP
ncbi:MAG: hypothetical protein GF417_05540, partial [Candidatus Latescibacteria bacterium]|nr:hypothetical protein [bacterium]MBD3423878.1 hypothetical protein [Candidatus Latescibacterota bacterium]